MAGDFNENIPSPRGKNEPGLNPKNGGRTHALECMYFEALLWTWPNLETENLKCRNISKMSSAWDIIQKEWCNTRKVK
jgi:hypothetical protein